MAAEASKLELEALLAEGTADARIRERTEFDRVLGPYSERLVLFGAGSLGRQVLDRLRRDGMEPLAFVDNGREKWGREIDGITVYSPADAAAVFATHAAFLVSIWNDWHRFATTLDQLTQLGSNQVHAICSFRWKHADEFLPFFFLDLPSRVFSQADSVSAAYSVWADEASRREFVAQVRMRLLGDLASLPPPQPNQYAPDLLFEARADEVFIDGGAFDGDTIRTFLVNYGGDFKAIHAIEPDPVSYGRLEQFIESLPPGIRHRIRASPIALGERAGVVRFQSSGTMGSALTEEGNIEVPCVTLDSLLEDRCASYVKMDIEGEELRALRGGIRAIRTCRPVLAICVYHTQDHLWTIPLFLSHALEDYSLFLRPHRPDGWDLILYAVPRERLFRA